MAFAAGDDSIAGVSNFDGKVEGILTVKDIVILKFFCLIFFGINSGNNLLVDRIDWFVSSVVSGDNGNVGDF